MIDAQQITAGMEVADTEGRPLGTVDHVEGDLVTLSGGSDAELHHVVPLAAVTEVSEGRVTVEPATVSAAEAMGHAADPLTVPDTPLFGTSGMGTGFGGSGRGES